MPDFSGRVALVTGASGGLGSAVTRVFLDAGAQVIGVARSLEQADPAESCISLCADLTTKEGVEAAVDEAVRQAKKIDVLVHVMGGFAGGQPVSETDVATWDKMMNLNLRAAFLVLRAVLPHMLQAGYGRIVAVGSRVGVEPAAGLSAYGVSKAGLNALVQTRRQRGEGSRHHGERGIAEHHRHARESRGDAQCRLFPLGAPRGDCAADSLALLRRGRRRQRRADPDLRSSLTLDG